jgi:putative membrane protein
MHGCNLELGWPLADITLLLSIAVGFLLGVCSGLVPGLHVNNFAALLLAISAEVISRGFSAFNVSAIILSASISQTFFDAIPAVFLGAPDADTALAVLPGHRLMLEGRGVEAIRLLALGSAGSVIVSLLLVLPLSWFFSSYYEILMKYVGFILLAIALMMIKREMGLQIEGQGSLVHLKYKAMAAVLFLSSGLLGIFAFARQDLLSSPLGLEPEVLLPLLSGLFGASSLILSLAAGTEIPAQEETRIRLPPGAVAKSLILGSLGGSVVAWIPGLSPSVAAAAARLGGEIMPEEFLISISGVSTANALFSLVALYAIGRPRSGAAAAIAQLITLDESSLGSMILIAIAVTLVSYSAVVASAPCAALLLSRVNYRLVCTCVLLGLSAMALIFTGLFGMLIFFLSALLGLIAPLAGVHRTHAMGVLMVPLIVHYL